MQIALFVLATAALIAPASVPEPAHLVPLEAVTPQAGRSLQPARAASRRFGLGSNISMGTGGVGGNFRYWFGERLGVELNASWYRPRSSRGIDRTSTALIAPSAIYMFRDFDDTRDVNVRPYAGGGVNYARASVPVGSSSALLSRARGTGGQAFGGVELTFKDVPQMSISAELVRYWLPASFANAQSALGGTDFVGSVFFYF
jgi:hypothetical protein